LIEICEVFKIAGIGKCIEVKDLIIRIFVYKKSDYMGSDKSGPSGN
jgi:hypothetical protein